MMARSKQMPLIWRNKTIVLLVFVQGDGKMVPSSSQGHRPKPSVKVLRKAPKAAKRGKSGAPMGRSCCQLQQRQQRSGRLWRGVFRSRRARFQAPGMVAEWALWETSQKWHVWTMHTLSNTSSKSVPWWRASWSRGLSPKARSPKGTRAQRAWHPSLGRRRSGPVPHESQHKLKLTSGKSTWWVQLPWRTFDGLSRRSLLIGWITRIVSQAEEVSPHSWFAGQDDPAHQSPHGWRQWSQPHVRRHLRGSRARLGFA
jgi:hypothetical protein